LLYAIKLPIILDNFVDANVSSQNPWYLLGVNTPFEADEANSTFGELYDHNEPDSGYFAHWNALKGEVYVTYGDIGNIQVYPFPFLALTPEFTGLEEVKLERIIDLNDPSYGIPSEPINQFLHITVVSYLEVVNGTETDTHIKINAVRNSISTITPGFSPM
jgi:hypothetical protein